MGLGSAIYIERGNFFNNTVTANEGSIALAIGKYFQESQLNLINSIVYGNAHPAYDRSGYRVSANSVQVVRLNQSGYAPLSITNCCIPSEGIKLAVDGERIIYTTEESAQDYLTIDGRVASSPLFADADNEDYSLTSGSPCVNAGQSEELENEGIPVDLPSTDMDYTNRIKDCAVDIGAYELDNEENIAYTLSTTTGGQKVGTYYVSQNGAGVRSGENAANAACAMKLQDILDDAGDKVEDGPLDAAVVKVAGYTDGDFVYHANTLSSTINPQSYSYVIPEGVTLMGGYFEGTFTGGNYNNDGWDNADDDHKRDPMVYRTVLSAVAVPAQGSTVTQEVQGYHAVTFGAWPGTDALNKEAVIDGVWLTDGSATSMTGTGNPATMGGGAIVPAGAHVRNCVVSGCEAVNGGGLYLMAGGTVSGTAIIGNSATASGGGIYADNEGAGADLRAHIISCTIADNEATTEGGGLRLEDGAAMSLNTVIWGNTAPQDKKTWAEWPPSDLQTQCGTSCSARRPGTTTPLMTASWRATSCRRTSPTRPWRATPRYISPTATAAWKEFSPLIKHGTLADYQDDLQAVFGVAAQDMQGHRPRPGEYGPPRRRRASPTMAACCPRSCSPASSCRRRQT